MPISEFFDDLELFFVDFLISKLVEIPFSFYWCHISLLEQHFVVSLFFFFIPMFFWVFGLSFDKNFIDKCRIRYFREKEMLLMFWKSFRRKYMLNSGFI